LPDVPWNDFSGYGETRGAAAGELDVIRSVISPASIRVTATAPRLVTRQAVVLGGMAAVATVAVMIAVLLDQGYGFFLRSDAETFYRDALDPFGDGRVFTGSGPDTGTAYRYGRILFPLTAWCLAFGQPALLRITIPIFYVGAIMLVATLAATQSELAVRPPIVGLAVLLVPSAFLTVPILVPALGTAVLVLLTRETAVLALAPLMFRCSSGTGGCARVSACGPSTIHKCRPLVRLTRHSAAFYRRHGPARRALS